MSLPCFGSFSGSQNWTLNLLLWTHIYHLPPLQWFSTRGICVPQGMDTGQCQCVGFFGCHNSSGRKGMLLNILQCGRQPLTIKNYPVQMLTVLRLTVLRRNPAVPSSLFSKHTRLSHMLLCLNIACFLYLECPALLLCLRNDHLSVKIWLKMSPPLCCPFHISQGWMFLLCFQSFWYIFN